MYRLFSSRRGIVWAFILLFAQAGFLVWMNTERIELAYDIKKKQQILREKQALAAKLEVEKNNLLAPYQLEQLAKKFDLKAPQPDQVWVLDEN